MLNIGTSSLFSHGNKYQQVYQGYPSIIVHLCALSMSFIDIQCPYRSDVQRISIDKWHEPKLYFMTLCQNLCEPFTVYLYLLKLFRTWPTHQEGNIAHKSEDILFACGHCCHFLSLYFLWRSLEDCTCDCLSFSLPYSLFLFYLLHQSILLGD